MTENLAELTMVLIVMIGLTASRRVKLPASEYAEQGCSDRRLETALLLWLVIIAMILVPVSELFSPWLEFADFPFFRRAAWGGLASGCAALMLFLAAEQARQLACRRGVPIMEVGIYRHIRHPLYSAMFLWGLAQWLLLQNWLAGPAAAVAILLVYLLRLPHDEQVMLQRFGHRYLDYMDRTGQLLPRWRRPR